MPVAPGAVDVLMPVRVLIERMRVQVCVPLVLTWSVKMQAPRGPPRPNPQSHEGCTYHEFRPAHEGRGHRDPGRRQQASGDHDHYRVAEPPPRTKRGRRSEPGPVSKKRIHGYHVIDLERMRSAEKNRSDVCWPQILHRAYRKELE